MKQKHIIWIIVIIAIVVIGYYVYKQFFSNACKKSETAWECIKRKSVASTKFEGAYDFPETNAGAYRFFSNGRVVIIASNPEIKGSYNKEKIIWDNNQGEISLKEVFSKK